MLKKNIENEIIGLYTNNLTNIFSINKISKLLKKKYPFVNKKVSFLINNKILNKIEIGKSYLCSLNLDDDKTLLFLTYNEIFKKELLKNSVIEKKNIENFLSKKALEYKIQSVFFSNDKLIFILDDLKYRRKIENEFSNLIIIDKNEFLDLLLENPIYFTDFVVFYGYEKFFELIKINFDELKNKYSPLKY
ncbi:MAG: hypothetical protein ACOC3X_02355 [Nanoarchaeota archaeon]